MLHVYQQTIANWNIFLCLPATKF